MVSPPSSPPLAVYSLSTVEHGAWVCCIQGLRAQPQGASRSVFSQPSLCHPVPLGPQLHVFLLDCCFIVSSKASRTEPLQPSFSLCCRSRGLPLLSAALHLLLWVFVSGSTWFSVSVVSVCSCLFKYMYRAIMSSSSPLCNVSPLLLNLFLWTDFPAKSWVICFCFLASKGTSKVNGKMELKRSFCGCEKF